MMSGVYAIRHRQSHKCYIGSAFDIEKRWKGHLCLLHRGKHHSPHLQSAWDKYGDEAFEFVILELCQSHRKHLIPMEQEWLDRLQSYDKRKGYNISERADAPIGERIREAQKARFEENPFLCEKVGENTRKQWADPEIRQRMLTGKKAYHKTRRAKENMKRCRAARRDYSQMARVRSFRKPGNQFRLWTPDDDAYLREHYPAEGIKACATALNRAESAIRQRASHLGIKVGNSKRERYRLAALRRKG